MVSNRQTSALPHLRLLNNHVASSLSRNIRTGQPLPTLPRQHAPATVAEENGLTGVSSFAFQVRPFT